MAFTGCLTIFRFSKYVLCRDAWTLTLFIILIATLNLLNPGSIDLCKRIIIEGA